MMEKRAAEELAGKARLTVGQLREMISEAWWSGGPEFSAVNATVPYHRALDIYTRALEKRQDDEVPDMLRAGEQLLVTNILRDAGPPP